MPGGVVELSLLRLGDRAKIESVGPRASSLDLAPGMSVSVGRRSDDGHVWNVILADGRKIEVPHEAADEVMVRVEGVLG